MSIRRRSYAFAAGLLALNLFACDGGGGRRNDESDDGGSEDSGREQDEGMDGSASNDAEVVSGDAGGSDTGVADAGLDLSCVELTAIRNFKADPSGLGVLFTAVTCADKIPVANLKPTDFTIAEDDRALSSEADPDFVPSRGRRVYISLLLDMSTSTAPAIDQLIAGAKAFVSELLEKRKINVYIGIELFDGAVNTTAWQPAIRDAARLGTKLDQLKTYKGSDGASTNLNGATITAINNLQQHQQKVIEANDKGVVTQGYLVVFTDGADSAGRRTVNDAAQMIANANASTRLLTESSLPPVDTYAVALNGKDYDAATFAELFTGKASGTGQSDAGTGALCSDTCTDAVRNGRCDDGRLGSFSSRCLYGTDCTDCRTVDAGISLSANITGLPSAEAKRRVVEAANATELAQRFSNLAQRIAGQLEGTYLLAYCSPKRQDKHKLTVSLTSAKSSSSTKISLSFDATGFAGGCSADLFTSSCDSKQCGGFNCGACDDETETCNAVTDKCVNACLAASPPHCDGKPFLNGLGYSQTCDFMGTLTQCGSTCIDTRSDVMNCGACNNRCNAGSTCVQGMCTCPNANLLHCGPTSLTTPGCYDGQTDRAHCGGCTNVCPAMNPMSVAVTCQAGACNCGTGYTFCTGSNTCVDVNTDRYNCGGCGIQCSGDATCSAGKCTCSTVGLTSCSSSSTSKVQACYNLQGAADNCGMCGKACGPGGTCSAGACMCTSPTTLCNGTCANFATDAANCGSCGNACPSGQVCSAGTCGTGPFAACSSATLSGSFPIMYSGQLGASVASSCEGIEMPSTWLQFVAPSAGTYSVTALFPGWLEAVGGTCASPSSVSGGTSCSSSMQLSLSAGAAVRLKAVGETAGTPFVVTVSKL